MKPVIQWSQQRFVQGLLTLTMLAQLPSFCFANEPKGAVVRSSDVERSGPDENPALRHALALSDAFRQAADRIRPSVVSIRTEQRVPILQRLPRPGIPEELQRFFGDDFGRFFDSPTPNREGVRRGYGSGIIVSSDGHLLTASHVVLRAGRIAVTTHDGKEFEAEVVGTDPKTDVAVLKIDVRKFSAARLANSDESRVGDWVIAVGGPFGLENTVTAGIVSATGRQSVGIADYETFLQTDAAINPGNSGGPLVNLRGEVVGINTAIATRSGSNAGVGFAVPSNMAKSVMDDLIQHGKVERGWLGVLVQELTPELAASFEYDGKSGVLIGDVTDGSPAKKSGLNAGDIIVRFNGKEMGSSVELRNAVAEIEPGATVNVDVFRDGKRLKIDVKLGLLDETAASDKEEPSISEGIGLTVRTLDPDMASRLGYEETQKGVLITQVEAGSISDRAGLQTGQIIVQVDGQTVTDVGSFRKLMTKAAIRKGVRMQILSDRMRRFLFLRSRDGE